MIPGKSIQWHYDACIEQWNWIAETGVNKVHAPIAIKYQPQNDCFMCELYKPNYCSHCPFVKQYGYHPQGVTCEFDDRSPYRAWKNDFGFAEAKEHAIALAKLIIDHYPIDYTSFDKNLKWKEFKNDIVQQYNKDHLTNYSGYSELVHKLTLKNWSCGKIGKMFNSSKNTINHHLKRMGVDRLAHGGSQQRKLTISQAKMIKNANSLKEAQDLCAKYGVSKQIIYNMKYGKSWKNI